MPLKIDHRKGVWRNAFAGLFLFFWFVFGSVQPLSSEVSVPVARLLNPDDFSRIAEMAGPAIVNIRTERTIEGGGPVFRYYDEAPGKTPMPSNPFFDQFLGEGPGRKYKERSLGSGFFFDKFGDIATNYHVVDGADKIRVRLEDGREFDAEVIGSDPQTDLALIRIDAQIISPVIPEGNSDQLRVGEWVMAIGSPFGLEQTLTVGIVSAKGRAIGMGVFDDFIQTDASINPGNSGGPLLNVKGEVVGVNTAMYVGSSGIGFAIPMNMARDVLLQIRESGKVSRGWLGITVQNIDDSARQYCGIGAKAGIVVVDVWQDTPADEAGIESNDIILEIDGRPVKNTSDMPRIMATIRAGETIDVKVLRDNEESIYKTKVTRRENIDAKTLTPARGFAAKLGVRIIDLSPETAARFDLEQTDGVLIIEADPRGMAAEAGILPGDIIKEVNHSSVKTVAGYKRQIRSIGKSSEVRFLIQRKAAGYLVVKFIR
jgi:serine protease Do